MKITNLSLAAIAVVGMMSVASADVDMKIGGQSVLYYQTMDAGEKDIAAQNGSAANLGLQLNATADIGSGFGIGVQASSLSTAGLEGDLVDGTVQSGVGQSGDTAADAGNFFGITKAYITKKAGATTFKLGRQELLKSLSPLAFSEGWNVYKNTFDALVAINSDIPDTTLVGAYVSRGNGSLNLRNWGYINQVEDQPGMNKGVFMVTAANKSVKGLNPTLSYYNLPSMATAVWGDVKADFGLPVKLAVQGGQISPENSALEDTKAIGAKISGKAGPANITLAYSKVNNGAVPMHNLGTGVKTPLYTQMVLNQWSIKKANDTFAVKTAMAAGPGKLKINYSMTTANEGNLFGKDNDYNELDVIYVMPGLIGKGSKVFAGYIMRKTENNTAGGLMGGDDSANVVRLWARYNF